MIIQYKSRLSLHFLYINIQLYMNTYHIIYKVYVFLIVTLSQHIHTAVIALNRGLFSQNTLNYLFHRVMNMSLIK